MAHRLKGYDAIEFKRKHRGGNLKKYNDPTEGARSHLSVDRAERIAREDPSLIYMDVPDAAWKKAVRRESNPRRVKLPSKFTMMPVRVNKKGEVQIGVNPSKLGSGGRFAKCVKSVEARGGAYDPNAVCAAAGRKKYGAKKMASMARAGKKRATKKRR